MKGKSNSQTKLGQDFVYSRINACTYLLSNIAIQWMENKHITEATTFILWRYCSMVVTVRRKAQDRSTYVVVDQLDSAVFPRTPLGCTIEFLQEIVEIVHAFYGQSSFPFIKPFQGIDVLQGCVCSRHCK